jgi:hypothetical protein
LSNSSFSSTSSSPPSNWYTNCKFTKKSLLLLFFLLKTHEFTSLLTM